MLSFGHILDEYVPKWNSQPKAYKATGEIGIEAPYWGKYLHYSCWAQGFIATGQKYDEDEYYIDIDPQHQLQELSKSNITCTHEIARYQQETINTCLSPHSDCPQ